MTERFITTDPINKEEYKEMETAIYKIVKGTGGLAEHSGEHSGDGSLEHNRDGSLCVASDEHSGDGSLCVASDTQEPSPCVRPCVPVPLAVPPTAVGIGGTITTVAALHQKLDPYDPEKVHNYKLTLKDINNLKEKLLSLTIDKIKQLKGIHPKRADIIVAGITILSIIMDNLKLNEIIVSEYDNLEGLLQDI